MIPDGAHYFRARLRMTGRAIIDPALLLLIAEKPSQDSVVLKEQRKAAEEADLQRKGPKLLQLRSLSKDPAGTWGWPTRVPFLTVGDLFVLQKI